MSSLDRQVAELLGWPSEKIKRTRTIEKLEAISQISFAPLKETVINCTPIIVQTQKINNTNYAKPKSVDVAQRKNDTPRVILPKNNDIDVQNLRTIIDTRRGQNARLQQRLLLKENMLACLIESDDIDVLNLSISHDVKLLKKIQEQEQSTINEIKHRIEVKQKLIDVLKYSEEFDIDNDDAIKNGVLKIEASVNLLSTLL